jgi:glycosyltransferase involved in cell wall biosynthesis
VSNQTGGELDEVRTIATELGVWDRIHVVPYVPQHQVPDYLSTADLGLICSQRTLNYELSLPTKLSEYVHGRLPVIASDVRALRATVEQQGFGEVFTSDDPASFAAAVRRGYAERAAMAARITDDFLTEFSWEAQSAGLIALYRQIAARVPETTRPDVPWTVAEGPVVHDFAGNQSWRRLNETPVRLGLGAANYAAQGAAFARAVTRAYDDVSAEVFMYEQNNRYGFPADVYLDADLRNSAVEQVAMLRRVRRYTHLLVDAFRPVLGYLNGAHIGDDLRMLASEGIRVGLLAHGSDVRDPVRHMHAYPHSLFRHAPSGTVERLTTLTAQNRELVAESGLPAFVTTPDLLEDLPTAVWTPVVVDMDAWRCGSPVMERARPVVLHAPTNRWTKGTDLIVPALEKLDHAGRIELRLVEGLDWAGMRAAIHDADVVVDQVTTGAYGTLAVEAMAAGRIVLAHLSEHVRAVVGTDLPIVEVTPETLVPAIESLLDDRGAAAKTGLASVDYAKKYHDGSWTARALGSFLHDPQ